MDNPPVRLGYGEKAHRTTAVFEYDFAVNGGAVGTLILGHDTVPAGWFATRVSALVETTLASGGAATIALGLNANGDFVPASGFAGFVVNTSVNSYPAVTPKKTTAGGLRLTIAGAALTAGKVAFVVEMDKRAA